MFTLSSEMLHRYVRYVKILLTEAVESLMGRGENVAALSIGKFSFLHPALALSWK